MHTHFVLLSNANLRIQRMILSHLVQTYIPSALMVVVSFASMLISPEQVWINHLVLMRCSTHMHNSFTPGSWPDHPNHHNLPNVGVHEQRCLSECSADIVPKGSWPLAARVLHICLPHAHRVLLHGLPHKATILGNVVIRAILSRALIVPSYIACWRVILKGPEFRIRCRDRGRGAAQSKELGSQDRALLPIRPSSKLRRLLHHLLFHCARQRHRAWGSWGAYTNQTRRTPPCIEYLRMLSFNT